jgi:hypothetical protein
MRTVNRIAAALLGLVLLVVGLGVVVNAALVLAGRRPWPLPLDSWAARWGSITVGDWRVLWASVVVGVIGLVVLVAQLWHWRPDRVPAGWAGSGWWLSRRTVRRRATAAAAAVSGVRDVETRLLGRRRLSVRARALPERGDAVRSGVRAELDRLTVLSDVDVRVTLREPLRRVA